MQAHADVVKKGYLKYKASKIKGRNAVTIPGPKTSYKELYTVFRAPSGSSKLIDFYPTDKKYSELAQPKWSVDISSTVCVNVFDHNRVCFCVELECGGACLFESKTLTEAEDWMACFNAVLFTKGSNGHSGLFYDVDLFESSQLHYCGPAFLELSAGSLIVWTSSTQEEVVRWKLSHIRSFKAKKTVLTIFTGSRSSTGVGEFYFSSPLSVQITHAIETLVATLKSKKSQSQTTSASALTAPLPPSGVRPLPPAPQQGSAGEMPGLLEHRPLGERMRPNISENIPPQELYEDPDKPSLAIRPSQLPQRQGPQSSGRGGYEDVDRDQLQSSPAGRKSSPPTAARRENLTPPSTAVYAQVDKSKKKRPVSDTSPPPLEPYGHLQHFESNTAGSPQQPDEYRKLEHGTRASPPQGEEYGRLEHAAMVKPGGFQAEEYGKLDRGAKEQSPPYPFAEYGRLEGAAGSPQTHPAEYGKLNSFDPYGTLNREQQSVARDTKPKKISGQEVPKFPGYETMDMEEADPGIYSEIDDCKAVAKNKPPPGYENRVITETPAERASFKQESSPPTSRSSRHGYVNVPNNGFATPTAPPVAPRRSQVKGDKSEQVDKGEESKENQKLKPKPKPAPKPKVSPKPKISS